MNTDSIERYADRVYAFALNRTQSREEADELAQEILFTAVKELPKLRDAARFESWLWGIANNLLKVFRRYKGKQRAIYSYDTLDALENREYRDEEADMLENEELYASLRAKIAMLSAAYRDIILLYYYDGLSTKQISRKLDIPEGTVTWRLSEARKKLKKECETMNETALRPVKLDIRINGEGDYNGTTRPFPYVYINDALSQNILYYCYDSPRSVEELAKLCGVPAYYIEDRLNNLVRREAVSAPSRGRYQTEFLIYSDKANEYMEKARDLFDPVIDRFVLAMKTLAKKTAGLGIYTAGKPEDERIYLYGMLALEHLSETANPVGYIDHPVRYDGCRWSYHAHRITSGSSPARGLGREASLNQGSRGCYSHFTYHFGGFAYRRMMTDREINICEEILTGKEITDRDAAASAIAKGYVTRKADGEFFVAVPAFTKVQKEAFDRLAEQAFAPAVGAYSNAVSAYVSGYRKLFPSHLKDSVTRACHYLFLTLYATAVCDMAKEKGLLSPPAPDSVCDVLIQFKQPAETSERG